MSLYEEYYLQYKEAINLSLAGAMARNEKHDLVVKPEIWIGMKFMSDRGVKPWDKEKFADLLREIYEKEDYKMLDCINAAMCL